MHLLSVSLSLELFDLSPLVHHLGLSMPLYMQQS